MFNKVRVKATCYIAAYSRDRYIELFNRLLAQKEEDAEWYKVSKFGFDPEVLAGIAGGNGNLIMIRYAMPVADTFKGGIDAVSVTSADEFRKFESVGVVELGFIFTTRDNKLFTEVEKVYLMHFAKKVLSDYAKRMGCIYAEVEASDGSSEDFFYHNSATETCDPLKKEDL
ncbi:hypothetical protein IJ162_00470 [Candidatus Saccharibacteria bacterium]|nr:hypothetical protein [Candidatus Saccharibacteria bacterium]